MNAIRHSIFFTAFLTVFIAELGDKTQFAALALATDQPESRWAVFLGASLALVTTTAIAMVAADFLGHWVSPRLLKGLAGLVFLILGIVSLKAAWTTVLP